jgi:hypothetical protein
VSLDVGEIESKLFLKRRHKEKIILGLRNISCVHGQQVDLLTLGFLLVFFKIFEEAASGGDNLVLVNSPQILEVVDDSRLLVERLQNLLVRHVIET